MIAAQSPSPCRFRSDYRFTTKAGNGTQNFQMSDLPTRDEIPFMDSLDTSSTLGWLTLAMKAAKIGAWTWDLSEVASDESIGKAKIVRTPLYNQILGVDPAQELTVDHMRTLIDPDDSKSIFKKMGDVIMGRAEEYDAEYRIHRTDGTLCWIHSWGRGFRNSDGKVVRMTGMMTDITESKQLEHDRDQFVATLSHDLRNPLAGARGNAELLEKYWNRLEDKEKTIARVIANIDRADRMVQDLLDVTKLRAGGGFDLVYGELDLATGTREVLEELSVHHGDRFSLQIHGDFQGSWPLDGIRRVIENLAGNAIKYGSDTTPVTVTLTRNADAVTLSVHNWGDPISPTDQNGLFEPFRRAKQAVKKGRKGWGLGLTVVHGIAGALQGRIVVESAAETGTTFSVVFPARSG
jgi:PAS domain S-box-containing protein